MADRQSDETGDDFSTLGLPPQSPLHFGELETKFHKRQELREGDRFVVKRKYAKGGLGEILIAEDQELNREVALKRIQDWHADNPESQSRFLLEAEITGGLEHPGIVPVYGLGTDEAGHPYYAMRLVRGESLNAAIRKFHGSHENPFDPLNSVEFRRLLTRFIDVCDAVEYAHSRGIIHRDIKPANVILGPYGETLLVDWGLAKVVGKSTANTSGNDEPTLRPTSGSSQLKTSAGSRVGTPGYMSPEQSMGRGELVDGRSDVFSLGATLYTLLVGEPSINRKIENWEQRIELGEYTPLTDIQPNVPRPLTSICNRAMQAAPENRYDSPRDLADDLERWLADDRTEAHRDNERWSEGLNRFYRRNRAWVLAGGLALTAISLGLLVFATMMIAKNGKLAEASKLASDNYAKAEEQRALAVSAVNKASDLAYQFMATSEETLALLPNQVNNRKEMIDDAVSTFRELADLTPDDSEVVRRFADSLLRSANLYRRIQLHDDAKQQYAECLDLFGQLQKSVPSDELQTQIIYTLVNRSVQARLLGDLDQASEIVERGRRELEIIEDTGAEETRWVTARLADESGKLAFTRGDLQKSLDSLKEASNTFRGLFRINVSGYGFFIDSLLSLARTASELDDSDTALLALKEAVSVSQQVYDANPGRDERVRLTHSRSRLSRERFRVDTEIDLAKADMQNAMREFEKIIVEHPRYREYQRLLSEAELVWAEHLIDTGEFEEASKYLDHSESVLRDGIERYDLIPWRSQMVDLKAVRSEWYAAQNSHASAIEEIRIAIQKQMSVMSSVPRSKYEDIRLSRLQAKLAKLTAKTLDDE